MARRGFRYELWVRIERAKEARDAIYREILEGASEPRRAADVPATPDTLAYATFYVHMQFSGLLRRRFRLQTDAHVARLAARLGGTVFQHPITVIHVSVREE